jgi:hypothetical protein
VSDSHQTDDEPESPEEDRFPPSLFMSLILLLHVVIP